jgi:tetratricopeptide (TPR) repeat protein
MQENQKKRIIFLSVPESLRGQIESLSHRHHDGESHNDNYDHDDDNDHSDYGDDNDGESAETGFSIDPAIPIPVELSGEGPANLQDLSWEMIVAGMLSVISTSGNYESENPADLPGTSADLSPERIDYYRRFVLAVRPDIFAEFNEAAILKARNGDFDLALEILSALEGLFPQSAVVRLNRALALEERSLASERGGREQEAETDNKSAEAIYLDLLKIKPPFPNGLFNAAFFFMKRNDFSRAADCFSRYIPLADDPEKKENAEIALAEIRDGGLDDDSFMDAYRLINHGSEEDALLEIRDFLERRPEVWNGWFVLGWALRRLRRWEDGAAAFRKVLELGGGNADTRNELAICLMETRDFKNARKELETSLREYPDNIKIISNLGVLALKQGDDDEAAAFFRAALDIEPDDPVAKNGLESLR